MSSMHTNRRCSKWPSSPKSKQTSTTQSRSSCERARAPVITIHERRRNDEPSRPMTAVTHDGDGDDDEQTTTAAARRRPKREERRRSSSPMFWFLDGVRAPQPPRNLISTTLRWRRSAAAAPTTRASRLLALVVMPSPPVAARRRPPPPAAARRHRRRRTTLTSADTAPRLTIKSTTTRVSLRWCRDRDAWANNKLHTLNLLLLNGRSQRVEVDRLLTSALAIPRHSRDPRLPPDLSGDGGDVPVCRCRCCCCSSRRRDER